ncbi:MAG: hypothetical protein HC838_17815 [Spirulinaceae cyanobacterium RM2_2_10]|nr:hypothetical protein [Spirulinaceae cyanobacterium SM2_1_0]NJO21521.1 hypothetical protein [Spirulinaceae cyanobacterium RM2_2_10]
MLMLCLLPWVPILCPVGIFSLLVMLAIAIIAASRDAIDHLRRLHQIPCTGCAYFTGCQYLKCTVNPSIALTEGAVACRDFAPNSHIQPLCTRHCK